MQGSPASSSMQPPSSRRRSWYLAAAFVAMTVAGAVLAYVASDPEVQRLDDTVVEGVIPDEVGVRTLDYPAASIVNGRLEEAQCGLSFHFLRGEELDVFNASGTLPPADLDCEVRSGRISPDARHLVIRNERGIPSNYSVRLTFFQVTTPYGALAIPSFFLVLVGSIGIALLLLRRGLQKTLEEIARKK